MSLGCGEYQVYVLPRGGGTSPIADIPNWSGISCGRVIDDTSQAEVQIPVDLECCEALNTVRPWQHELIFYRSGEELWAGPIRQVSFAQDQIRIVARDLSAWWDKRRIHEDHNYQPVSNLEPDGIGPADLATILNDIITDGMSLDNSPNVTFVATPCGVTGTQKYLSAQHLMLGPVVRDISKVGIDWTTIGRTILAGGVVVPTAPIGVLVDESFITVPTVTFDGDAQTNEPLVRGAGGGDSGDVTFAVSADTGAAVRDGLLEEVTTRSDLIDSDACQAAADSRLALATTPVSISNAILSPDISLTADELIPGALVALDLVKTCTPVIAIYRIMYVNFRASAGGNPTETIEIGIQPVGTTT